MKRFAFSFILFLGLLFLFTKCGSADAGEKTANQFFSAVLEKDFQKAANMMEPPLGDPTNAVRQAEYLQNNPSSGQLQGFKKRIGFSTNISNGITTVQLPYALQYENGVQVVNVVIKNRGNGYNIASVE